MQHDPTGPPPSARNTNLLVLAVLLLASVAVGGMVGITAQAEAPEVVWVGP